MVVFNSCLTEVPENTAVGSCLLSIPLNHIQMINNSLILPTLQMADMSFLFSSQRQRNIINRKEEGTLFQKLQ